MERRRLPTKETLAYSYGKGRRTVLLDLLKTWVEVLESKPSNASDDEASMRAYQAAYDKLSSDLVFGDLALEYFLKPEYVRQMRLTALSSPRSAKTAISLLIERSRTGVLPSALPDLGEDSKDPYGGKQLRYWKDQDYAYVYSVGSDGFDSHGKDWRSEAGIVRIKL